jgi:hypothetical protein
MNPMAVDECQYFFRLGYRCHWKMAHQVEHRTVRKTAASDLANDERMDKHARIFKRRAQTRVAATQMIHPDRSVDEDQDFGEWRRRGAGFSSGWVPPKRARRRALSRSISARKPSCTTADRSRGPTSFDAFSSKASSILMVVRTGDSPVDAGSSILAPFDAKLDARAFRVELGGAALAEFSAKPVRFRKRLLRLPSDFDTA